MINFETEINELLNKKHFLVLPDIGAFNIGYTEFVYDNDLNNFGSPSLNYSFNSSINKDAKNILFNHIQSKHGLSLPIIKKQYQAFKTKTLNYLTDEKPNYLNKNGEFVSIQNSDFEFLKDIKNDIEIENEEYFLNIAKPEKTKSNYGLLWIIPLLGLLGFFAGKYLKKVTSESEFGETYSQKEVVAEPEIKKESLIITGFFKSKGGAIKMAEHLKKNGIKGNVHTYDSLFTVISKTNRNPEELKRRIDNLAGINSKIITENE